MSFRCGFGVCAAVLCASSATRAEGPRLLWSAPLSCPTETTLRERVAATLGAPLESFDPNAIFEATVERTEASFRLILKTLRGQERGSRELWDPDCNALTSAAAVAIALALRGSTAADERAPDRAEPKEAEPRGRDSDVRVPEERPRPAARDPARPRASRSERHVGAGWALVALVDRGTLPTWAPGIATGPSFQLGRASLGLAVGALLPTRTDHKPGGSFWLGLAEIAGCVQVLVSRPAFVATCVLLESGVLVGTGRGVAVSTTDSAPWLAMGGRLSEGFRVGSSPFWGLVGLSVLGRWTRPEFVLNGRDPVHTPSPVVARIQVGILREFR